MERGLSVRELNGTEATKVVDVKPRKISFVKKVTSKPLSQKAINKRERQMAGSSNELAEVIAMQKKRSAEKVFLLISFLCLFVFFHLFLFCFCLCDFSFISFLFDDSPS